MPPPILTARLALRAYVPEDVGEVHAVLFSDPEVMRHVGGPLTLAQAQAEIERAIVWQEELGHSSWAVLERETGLIVGEAGLVPRDAQGPQVELGYAFATASWGRGYATEAATSLLGEAFGPLGLEEVLAHVRDGNDASLRVLAKLGFVGCGRAHAWGAEQRCLVRTREAPGPGRGPGRGE